MLLAFSVLSACGENKSGGGSSSKSSGIGNGQTGYTTQGENYSNIDEVRNQYNSKSLADGISNGTNIYHVGTYFGGSNSGGGQVSVNVYGCLNLIFWQVGDCDSNNGYDINSYLESALNMGRIWQVQAASGESISINEAYDVLNNDYLFQPETFDRNSAKYREMLGLNRNDIVDVRISNASITLTNGQVIPSTLVEYFYGNNYTGGANITGMKRFILSANLPVVANPVAVIDGNGAITGYLSNVGNGIKVKSLTVTRMHGTNYYGQIQQTSGQQTVNISY
tara:strand:- start:43168 stop:44007 length:840 start_codon:yes stop_codon:yes gene_type:complete